MDVAGFWSRVDKTSTCWLWTGKKDQYGYGSVRWNNGQYLGTHRVAWMLVRGEIPQKTQIDHLCRVTLCVNPDHMELVTQAENGRRGIIARGRDTHCAKGHEYAVVGAYDGKWRRRCKACAKESVKRHQKKYPEKYREKNRRAAARRYKRQHEG